MQCLAVVGTMVKEMAVYLVPFLAMELNQTLLIATTPLLSITISMMWECSVNKVNHFYLQHYNNNITMHTSYMTGGAASIIWIGVGKTF